MEKPFHKLGEYELRELVKKQDRQIKEMKAELAEYRRKREAGLIPPCEVGDTVYRICPKCNDKHCGSCDNCAWQSACFANGCTVYGLWDDGQYPASKCQIVPYKTHWNYIPNLMKNLGKTVFLTREAAEAALQKEIKE